MKIKSWVTDRRLTKAQEFAGTNLTNDEYFKQWEKQNGDLEVFFENIGGRFKFCRMIHDRKIRIGTKTFDRVSGAMAYCMSLNRPLNDCRNLIVETGCFFGHVDDSYWTYLSDVVDLRAELEELKKPQGFWSKLWNDNEKKIAHTEECIATNLSVIANIERNNQPVLNALAEYEKQWMKKGELVTMRDWKTDFFK